MATELIASLSEAEYLRRFHGGAYRPYMAEISPYQYGQLSPAARRRHDREQDANRRAYQHGSREYAAIAWQSFEAGIPLIAMHPNARQCVTGETGLLDAMPSATPPELSRSPRNSALYVEAT